MAKDPAILFYTGDFLTGVSDLTMEERGQYITLLCLQHQKGHLSEKTIEINVGKVSDDVLKKFKKDKQGFLYQKRMDEETEKRRKHCEKQRENVMKRWNKRKEGDIPNKYDGNTVVIPLENENENENISNKVSKKERVIKHKYGSYQNVLLSDEEYQKLISEYGKEKTNKAVEFLSNYREEKGYKNKNDYLSIRRWVVGAVEEKENKPSANPFKDKLKELMQDEQTRSNGGNVGYQGGLSKLLQKPDGD